MKEWKCVNCNEKTPHEEKDPEQSSFSGYKILVCSICDNKEMVPEHILDSIEEENEEVDLNNNIAVDGGFDREVDPDCESGICGAR